jgi:hypothetical protein
MATVETLVERRPPLIAQVRRTADYVIGDTAPVNEVRQSLRLAAICDQSGFGAHPSHPDRRRSLRAAICSIRAGFAPVGMALVDKETGLPLGRSELCAFDSPGGQQHERWGP